ncbi:MAG TPA: MerC domain-containing protein [Burkholderiales bacterium]|nr:MerC domain-containing protein [Burkholderiales bacterium]
MQRVQVQKLLDRIAISASVLCMFHCMVMPLLLVAIPVISSTFMADERFHGFLVKIVLPVSLIALFLGCRRHKDRAVFILGGCGLAALVAVAYLGHALLGEFGEKAATVVSGVILAIGHVRNYHLCRHDGCDA